ncbi:hypothetical protein KQX54_017153 [Cotesia glomerata]|uniref:BEN domain-containing protein n=1 Tax=Cotesia glomerata TaxID=32391 RepID=A0AAV7I8T5_COTGL|nr:hypothetical protein KQX54_017153 [Cotesia glomerata]
MYTSHDSIFIMFTQNQDGYLRPDGMLTNMDHKKLYYVVQFLDPPFKTIDEYVCVPSSWVILEKSSEQKGNVTYPNNENPSDTRRRVKRRKNPNDDWRFYPALIKFESENYKKAKHWISRNSCYESDEEELGIRDTQKPEQNKNPCREIQPCSSGSNSDKPELTLKTDSSPRKPLPKISMRRLLSQKHDETSNKRLKLDDTKPKPGIVTDHITTASECSKQKQSIIITGNQVIQKEQIKTSCDSNDKVNTDQNTQSAVVKENRSVKMSIQSISSKLLAKHQHSYQPPTEQQQSQQPPTEQQQSLQPLTQRLFSLQPQTDREPPRQSLTEQQPSHQRPIQQRQLQQPPTEQQQSRQPPPDLQPSLQPQINRQPSPKLMAEQHSLSKLSDEQQPVTDGRLSTKTPPSIIKPYLQPDPMNERQTPLVPHEYSLLEPHSRVLSAGQSKESNKCLETHLHGIPTAPTIISRPPSTTNQPSQQYRRYPLPTSSVSKNLNSKLQPQESFGKNSVEVTDKQSILRFKNIIDNITSTSHDDPNLVKLSQMLKVEAKKLFPLMKEWMNSVDETISHESITKNIPTVQHPPNSIRQFDLLNDSTDTQSTQLAQHHLQQARVDDSQMNNVKCMMSQRDPLLQNITSAPTAQKILMLTEQDGLVLETSREQQNLPTREDYVQQLIRQQNMLKRPTMTPTLDQKGDHQSAMMNGGFVLQSQSNSINQPIQVLLQNENQYVSINNVHTQKVKRDKLMKRSTDRVHIIDKPVAEKEVNIQSAAHNLLSQSHQDTEHPQQKQDQLNYRDPPTTNTQNSLRLRLKCSSHNSKPQRITKRSRSLPPLKTSSQALLDAQKSSFNRELGLQERVNQSSTTCNNMNLAAAFESHQINHEYQHPHMKKTMVAQAAETDSMMDVDHSVEAVVGSTISKSASKVVESARQSDEYSREEQASFNKETASDSENPSEHETKIKNEVVPEATQTILTAGQNLTTENKHVQSRIFIEQDMMDVSSTLFTQMSANLAFARDMFDCLRNTILTCAQTHETLLKKVIKLNSIEPFQSFSSLPNNVISQASQERPARDNDNATIVGNATTSIREQRGSFSLPAEYDPNDTKWTLKYREIKPGLVELIPQTGVYVESKELERCIRESSDCRTLACLLLTEVFSQNALSVCSWTGGKAKAFNSVNIDVRPGLDENARMVLLAFVEEHGKKHSWSTFNTSAVMSTIRTKIKDIRDKHEWTCKA